MTDPAAGNPFAPGRIEETGGFRWGEPAVGVDGLLRDIRQHGISAPERYHCHLREEESDCAENIVRTEQQYDQSDRRQPQGQPYPSNPEAADDLWMRVGWQGFTQKCCLVIVCAMSVREQKIRQAEARAEVADQSGGDDDQGKWNPQKEDRHKRQCCDHLRRSAPQRPPTHPKHGLDDDGEHRGLQAEQQPCDNRYMTKKNVNPTERHYRDDTR